MESATAGAVTARTPRRSMVITPTAPVGSTSAQAGRNRVQVQDPAAGRRGRAVRPRTVSASTYSATRSAVPPDTPHPSGAASTPPPPVSGRTAPTARCGSSAPQPPTDHHHRRDPRTAPRRCPGPTTRAGLGQRYRAILPKAERKIGHLMRRRHGGRRARVRGTTKIAADFRAACRHRQPRTAGRAHRGQHTRIKDGSQRPDKPGKNAKSRTQQPEQPPPRRLTTEQAPSPRYGQSRLERSYGRTDRTTQLKPTGLTLKQPFETTHLVVLC